jgi:lysophospholipase L1-like esterase
MPDKAQLESYDSSFIVDQPQKRLIEFAESRNIPYLDLLPGFIETNETYHFENDIHLTEKGHEFVAEQILNWIN